MYFLYLFIITITLGRLTPLRTRFCNSHEAGQQNIKFWKVWNRVSVLQLTVFAKSSCADETDEFYSTISTTYSCVASGTMDFIVGDWNAKAGTRTYCERCVGSHERGCRNMMGELLTHSCETFNLFQRHKSTWT